MKKSSKNKFIGITYKNNQYSGIKKYIVNRTIKLNSLFKKNNNSFFYKNVNDRGINFVFDEKELIFDNDKSYFCKFILKIIKKEIECLSFKFKLEKIQYISDVNDNFLIKEIELGLNTLYYKNELNPIDISCFISFNILTHHYLTNGNKRTSIMFLTDMLEYGHLFLSYSNTFANRKDFKTRGYILFTDYLKKYEERKENKDKLYSDFRTSILDGTFLDVRSIKK